MDSRTEHAVEAVLEQELFYNERTIEHPTFGQVCLRRPTPAQERLISEARRKQYHSDLKDDAILSKDEIEAIAVRRGMWSPTLTQKIQDLTVDAGRLAATLDAFGFESMEVLLKDYDQTVSDLLDLYEEEEEVRAAILRYFSMADDAASLTSDRSAILDAAPSTVVDDLVERGEAQKDQIRALEAMFKFRQELNELQVKQARLYVDSLESRADRAEELARIYYCCTQKDSGAPLWPTFADIWNCKAEDMEILVLELAYFVNGISQEYRDKAQKYGFLPRLASMRRSSESSPGQPQSNSDGESQESEVTDSSPATE